MQYIALILGVSVALLALVYALNLSRPTTHVTLQTVANCANFLKIYVSSHLLVNRLKSENLLRDMTDEDWSISSKVAAVAKTATPSNSNPFATSSRKKLRVMLQKILRNNSGFMFFMSHLISEFSYECLLSFVEFVQFKQRMESEGLVLSQVRCGQLSESFTKCEYDKLRIKYHSIEFSSRVPNSTVVYQDDEFDKMKVFNMLYLKYIVDDCPFQINVSFDARRKLDKIYNEQNLNSIDPHIVFHVFDQCVSETYSLLVHSFERFIDTDEFLVLADQLGFERKSQSSK